MLQHSPTAEFERLRLTRMTCDRIRSANYHLTDHLAELLGAHPELEQMLHIGKGGVDKVRKAEATQRDLMGTPFCSGQVISDRQIGCFTVVFAS